MPFDFQAYDQKCAALTAEELQREWQHYTRLITGAATSTTVSGLALPLTLGVSSVGIAMAAPAIHNARKKREIIERHLQRHDARHVTRKRDVLGGAAVSGTIGVVTLGVGTMGADAVAQQGAEHGINAIVANETAIKVVTHAALDGVGMGVEHMHTDRVKKREARKAFEKAGVFQAVDNAKAQEAGYAYEYNAHGQQQYPYGLQPQHTGASSSRLSIASVPPPYSPGQGQSMPIQQPTQYQPTAMNVPAYYNEQYPQYATVDAKVDPYTPPAADARSEESKSKEMDDLIANIDQQLKMTETSTPPQTSNTSSLSYQAGPVDTQYELEGDQAMAQPQVYQHPQESKTPQPPTVENIGDGQVNQGAQLTALSPEHPPVLSEPIVPLCSRPPEHVQSSPAQSIGHGQENSQTQQTPISPEQPLMTPQSTVSSYPSDGQNNQTATYIAQPVPTHPTAPLPERYVPTPMTPPTHESVSPAHQQQPIQPPVSYVPTPMTPPTFHQHEPNQPQTYFPPPPPVSVSAPPPQYSRPITSKRKSIMAAVALKATQTLAQHRTPSSASYGRPQYSAASSPQPQGQPYMYSQQPQGQPHVQPQLAQQQPHVQPLQPQQHQAYQQYHVQPQQEQVQPQPQQFHPQQAWSQPQQHGYQNPHYGQPTQAVQEPVYEPVPVPQAYSTRPQSQIFPPTPISPPNIPTVQPQQQQPGYFPPPAEYKPGHFGGPTNVVSPPIDQGQVYYAQR